MKNIYKNFIFIILLSLIILPTITLAQNRNPLVTMAENVATVIAGVAAIIVVIMWIITGVLFLTATGDPTKLTTAKKSLFMAIGGTVIVILAYSAMNIISNVIFRGV